MLMRLPTILFLSAALAGCDPVPPPSDAQVAAVAATCKEAGMVVRVYSTGSMTEVACVKAPERAER